MKLQLNDEKNCVDPWSHIDTFEGWSVLPETIVVEGWGFSLTQDSQDLRDTFYGNGSFLNHGLSVPGF